MIRERIHLLINFSIMIGLGVVASIPGLVPWYLLPLNIVAIMWMGMMVGSATEKLQFMNDKGVIER